IGYYISRRPRLSELLAQVKQRIPTFAMAVVIAMFVIWAVYRFSFGPVTPGGISVPAPELFKGFQEVQTHLGRGHDSYLLGQTSKDGFWDYYLIALAVKTPLGFLALTFVGFVLTFRKYPLARFAWLPFTFSLAVLSVGMTSTINIGVRHVLPVYVGYSLLAAVAIVKMIEA